MGILTGYKVLDFTQFLCGPTCTMMLGDLGADVIKIERPDKSLAAGPYLGGERTYDLSIDRGKRSITLDLQNKINRDAVLCMAKDADVIVENFKPGTMKKFGLTFEDVKKVNPQIIYTSISGYGHTGPLSNRGAFDLGIQAMSGFMSLTGDKGGHPVKAGASIADIYAGVYAAFGTVSMLLHRERTGEGQYLDLSMLDCMFSVCENVVTNYLLDGLVPERIGNRHRINAPFQDFPTADGDIIIMTTRNTTFGALCDVLGHPELKSDPRFNTTDLRRINADELADILKVYTREWKLDELAKELTAHNVSNAVINTIDRICAHPQIEARGMITELEHPTAGKYRLPNSPFHFSKTPPEVVKAAPICGADTLDVFREFGFSEETIAEILKTQEGMHPERPEGY